MEPLGLLYIYPHGRQNSFKKTFSSRKIKFLKFRGVASIWITLYFHLKYTHENCFLNESYFSELVALKMKP